MCIHYRHVTWHVCGMYISVHLSYKDGSPFGVILLGGVRDSSGQLQTYVTSVDDRHKHEEGFGIKEGECMYRFMVQ